MITDSDNEIVLWSWVNILGLGHMVLIPANYCDFEAL